jgi:UDP-galactopyranose mutase
VFFTGYDEVTEYISSMVKLRQINVHSLSYVEEDGNFYSYPIQYEDIDFMPDKEAIRKEISNLGEVTYKNFEEYWRSCIGNTLFTKFMCNYSKKMYGVGSNKEIVADWEWPGKGVPIRSGDRRLFGDFYQGYPENIDGWNPYFDRCLVGSDCLFNCVIGGLDSDSRIVRTNLGEFTADIIINTISLDDLFNYEYGRLRYRGRDFMKIMLPIKEIFPKDVYWIHYCGSEVFTRVTEYKKITGYESDDTILGVEIPSNNGKLYPVQSEPEMVRYQQYKDLFPKDFYSVGRLGNFKYMAIHHCIKEVLDLLWRI